ncbi:hypothetical protein U1Q18_038768 [Sarracenia purpurea var. burkii]
MERDNVTAVVRSRDHLLESLKAEVSALRSKEEMRRAELEKERADFEEKVIEKIARHMTSRESSLTRSFGCLSTRESRGRTGCP